MKNDAILNINQSTENKEDFDRWIENDKAFNQSIEDTKTINRLIEGLDKAYAGNDYIAQKNVVATNDVVVDFDLEKSVADLDKSILYEKAMEGLNKLLKPKLKIRMKISHFRESVSQNIVDRIEELYCETFFPNDAESMDIVHQY